MRREMKIAVESYNIQCGRYPTSAEGLGALLTNTITDGWHGPFLDGTALPVDGWGRNYRYLLTVGGPEIRSAGPDMMFDTADDIVSK